jgi:hypothetical protein
MNIEGHVQKGIINFKDYEKNIEAVEDTALLSSMMEVKNEILLSIEQALVELEKD